MKTPCLTIYEVRQAWKLAASQGHLPGEARPGVAVHLVHDPLPEDGGEAAHVRRGRVLDGASLHRLCGEMNGWITLIDDGSSQTEFITYSTAKSEEHINLDILCPRLGGWYFNLNTNNKINNLK